MNWLDEVKSDDEHFKYILSLDEYMQIYKKSPYQESRSSAHYLKDIFDYYGKNEDGAFKLFRRAHPDAPPVAGQQIIQGNIYQNLRNFVEEGFNNKFILLVGPNGSAKSSLIKKIMKCAEEYSHTDEGALYTFSWIFPIDQYTKGSLGLTSKNMGKAIASYAHLDDSEISAILTSELKDHPLLLIPLKTRQKMINEHLKDKPEILESIQKSNLYNGDLSKRSRLIFDALLKNYDGDYEQVYKHIRVERFFIDKRYSIAAATIEPQLHVDAKLQQITMDKRLNNLPPSLQSLNLFNLTGEVVLANRGILEFSDLLKRPLDTFKYLLMTMETKNINLQGILTELDIFFIGSSNEVHMNAFKQHPDFNSFKGRFSFIKVPYLMNYIEEQEIYQEQIQNLKEITHFEPHSIEMLCLWSVMTRMLKPAGKTFKDKKLAEIAEKLTPLEKALLIAEKKVPEYLDSEESKILRLGKDEIITEYINDEVYEGRFGISPREIKQIIYELASAHKSITFIEIMDHLKELSEKKADFDFLQIPAQGDFHNPKKFLYLIEQHTLNIFDNELRESLGLIDNRSYEEYVEKYVQQINALNKGERIKNNVTGKFEDADMYLIKEFENNLNIKDSPKDFRSNILSTLGAYSLDNPGVKIVYTDVLDSITKQLKETFRNEQKKIIFNVAKNLVYYVKELAAQRDGKTANSGMSEEARGQISKILSDLHKKFNYSEAGAINILKYLIKKRYDTNPS
jgi:predicted Ser/Thr protein kinase